MPSQRTDLALYLGVIVVAAALVVAAVQASGTAVTVLLAFALGILVALVLHRLVSIFGQRETRGTSRVTPASPSEVGQAGVPADASGDARVQTPDSLPTPAPSLEDEDVLPHPTQAGTARGEGDAPGPAEGTGVGTRDTRAGEAAEEGDEDVDDVPSEESSLEVEDVLARVERAAAGVEPLVSAVSLWLFDPASATLRLVGARGPMRPASVPLSADDGVLWGARDSELPRLDRHTLGEDETDRTGWRFAWSVSAGETAGVVAVDAVSPQRPDPDALEDALRSLRPSISGCLALMLARDETRIVRSLVEIARDLSRALSERELLEAALEHAMAMSTAATGSVMLADRSDRLRIRLARGLPDGVIDETVVSKGEGIAGWVFATEEPLLVEDIPARNANRGRRDVRSAVSVPIRDEDGVIGVLNVGSRAYPARLTHTHVDALEVIGRQTAVALRNARAVAESRDLYFDTLRIFAEAMERKDPQARGGARRTLELARHVASELGMDAHEARAVEIAALFHDLGMSALGGEDGSRPLSTVEHGIVTMHPVIAAELLEDAPALREVAPIVYHHHERFDGGGYVGGLEGEEIPLGARVLAVVDAYVSMTSIRPYREALSFEDAAASLREGAGTQFDPHVVEVFLEALETTAARAWAPRRSD